MRSIQVQTRNMYMVFLAFTLLMCELRQNRTKEWALQRLTTIREVCRTLLRENPHTARE